MAAHQTARMYLRPIRPYDKEEYIRVIKLSRDFHQPWSPRLPPEIHEEDLFERAISRHESGECSRYLGILPDDRIAGFFNLNEIVRGCFQNAYMGWMINLEVAGQGFATEGVAGLLDLAFSVEGLHRVQANIIPRNIRSIRVAEKNGFRREGLALRYLEIDGQWEDHWMYAKLADEHPRLTSLVRRPTHL